MAFQSVVLTYSEVAGDLSGHSCNMACLLRQGRCNLLQILWTL